MELTAVIHGLRKLKRGVSVAIHTDSRYVMDGAAKWLTGWKTKGWKTAGKKPVKNEDLWRALDAEMVRHRIQWHWVPGHSGHPENERADQLARDAIPRR
jgi:ribonuclease HI